MLTDIVLDTNILMHAHNPEELRHDDCRALVQEMTKCATHLCVDEGFDLNEANNRSVIGSEYLKHLGYGTVGHALVTRLASSLRVKYVSSRVPPKVSRNIMKQVSKGPDRTFLKVAFNSQDKTLACHDFNDIPAGVRTRLRKSDGLQIVDAIGAVVALR
jgi:hypothetical protein